MPDGRKWVVERDASVTNTGHLCPPGSAGYAPSMQALTVASRAAPSLIPCAEVVSPVCRWEDIPMVQEVVRAIREAGARTDSSCGIHVHVGFGEHTPASLRRLVNIVNIGHHCPSGSAGYAP